MGNTIIKECFFLTKHKNGALKVKIFHQLSVQLSVPTLAFRRCTYKCVLFQYIRYCPMLDELVIENVFINIFLG